MLYEMTPARPHFTFLHAADLHLDSPLRGLQSYPGAPADRLRNASREAFTALVDLALAREVGFVILAGDLFDGDWVDFNSGMWFMAELRRLTGAGIQAFVIRGNHDAENKVTRKLSWPTGVTEFKSKKAHTVMLEEFAVAVHGQSYGEQHVTENLALGYPDAAPDHLNIGILHTGLEGYEGHGHYAPCTLDDLRTKGYDYWALGHIHRREVVAKEPWVVFPGNLQGRHVKETGAKGATLVEVRDGKITGLEAVSCDVARWAHIVVDVTGSESDAEVLMSVDAGLKDAVAEAEGRLLAVRIEVQGATTLDPSLRTEQHRWTQELRGRAADLSEDLWIEKLKVRTTPALTPTGMDSDADDTMIAFADRLPETELPRATLDAMARDLNKLSAKLPSSVRAMVDPSALAALDEAMPEAQQFLSALLRKDGTA
jgi:DNA repair exonuclease SbcCD nuclease subunit